MDNSLKITALQPEVLVRLLKQAGSRTASPEMIAEDLASGAPQLFATPRNGWQC